MPELSEVNEELAEQNAEGGTQPQSGTQAQVGFQLPSGTFVNPGIGFPTLQAFPVSIVHIYFFFDLRGNERKLDAYQQFK